MEGNGNFASYSDLTLGFVGGINSIGPLIAAMAPDLKLTVRIVLEDTGDEAYLNLSSRPPRVERGAKNKTADITLFAKARDFHDILLGRLNLMKAQNDKRILLEMTPNAFSGMPVQPPTASVRTLQIPGFVYEWYLVSIGARKILDEPPSEDGVAIEPRKEGLFANIVGAIAWMGGVFFGAALKLWKYFSRKPDPKEPPKIQWKELEGLPQPGPPQEPGKLIRAVFRWFFKRGGMFSLAESFVDGARAIRAV